MQFVRPNRECSTVALADRWVLFFQFSFEENRRFLAVCVSMDMDIATIQ
jgi:hypothetical protein